MANFPGPLPPARVEPTSNTVADLVALVVGVALAASLEWYSGWYSRQAWLGFSPPGWFVVLIYFNEATRKGLLAMVPVILSRRIRYGGPIRPAEFPALSDGFYRLLVSFERWPALGLIIPPTPGVGTTFPSVDIDRYRLWMLICLVFCGLALGLAATLRRRLAPWALGVLLASALATSAGVEQFSKMGRDAILDQVQLPRWGVILLDRILNVPFAAIGLLPMTWAWSAAIRGGRGRWTWVEKACLGMATLGYLGMKAQSYIRTASGPNPSRLLELVATDAAQLIVASGICFVLARWSRSTAARASG